MTEKRLKKPPDAIPDKDLRFKIVVRMYGAHGDSTYGHSYIVDDVPLGISAPIAEYYLDATTYTFKELRYLLQYNTTTAGHMKKRSLVFQEALFIMSRMPNIYNRYPFHSFHFNKYHILNYIFLPLYPSVRISLFSASSSSSLPLALLPPSYSLSSSPTSFFPLHLYRPRVELNQYQFGFIKKKTFDDVKLVHPDRETEPIANLIGRTDFFEHDLMLVPLSQIPPDLGENNDDRREIGEFEGDKTLINELV